jgi:hypothetical protein
MTGTMGAKLSSHILPDENNREGDTDTFTMALQRALASLLIFNASFLGNRTKLGSISPPWYMSPW